MQTDTSGKRWARFGLGLGATLSILGNETHTVLVSSSVNLVIRVVLAFIWPAALFVAVEIFVRVAWRRRLIDYLGRGILLGPVSMVAAVVSYQHIHALMLLGGEDGFSALVGPVAIDGLMLGSTVALLAIRAASLAGSNDPASEQVEEADAILARYESEMDENEQVAYDEYMKTGQLNIPQRLMELPDFSVTLPVSPAPVTRRPRAPRTEWSEQAVVRMVMDGEPSKLISESTGASIPTINRIRQAYTALKADPRGELPATARVSSSVAATLRQEMTR